MISDESEGGDGDEVICVGWGMNQEESEQNEAGRMKKADCTE